MSLFSTSYLLRSVLLVAVGRLAASFQGGRHQCQSEPECHGGIQVQVPQTWESFLSASCGTMLVRHGNVQVTACGITMTHCGGISLYHRGSHGHGPGGSMPVALARLSQAAERSGKSDSESLPVLRLITDDDSWSPLAVTVTVAVTQIFRGRAAAPAAALPADSDTGPLRVSDWPRILSAVVHIQASQRPASASEYYHQQTHV